MKLLFLKEKNKNEKRVALTPELVTKYQQLGFTVLLEKGAGAASSFSDEEYKGAEIVSDVGQALATADVIISVAETDFDLTKAKKDAALVALLNPGFNGEKIAKLKEAGIKSFALELVPRITRAQTMDVLSSQSNLAGYRAVIDAVYETNRACPMMMTAAGTVAALRFMIVGAGVAGLQAIATAKRLGGVVCAFDVRKEAKEQVQSLGAKFIEVKSEQTLENQVYAKEMSEEYKKAQQQLLKDTIKTQDVIITTALIPNKKAPTLITEEMVNLMKSGSIIVDLAAQNGGNCALTKPGEVIEINGVKIIGYNNFPSRIARDASKLYARNIFNFVTLLADSKTGSLALEDEIIKATML